MSLKDGKKKMSKSDPSDLSRINLTDDKDKIINKIKQSKSDTMTMPSEEEDLKNRPEVLNLLENQYFKFIFQDVPKVVLLEERSCPSPIGYVLRLHCRNALVQFQSCWLI